MLSFRSTDRADSLSRTLRGTLSCLAVACFASCATGPSIEEAPLAEERRSKLEKSLVGEWRATHRAPEEGTREPIEGKTPMWTFRSDGTGAYGEGVGGSEGATENFEWRLEGRNLMLTFDSNRPTQYFRAESWSAAQMRWWNYRDEHLLILRGTDLREKRREPESAEEPRRRDGAGGTSGEPRRRR